jgi:hypothetical protein
MIVDKRPLDEVSGTVDILISSPLKRFSSANLTARIAKNSKAGVEVVFQMTPPAYQASNVRIKLGRGYLTGDFTLARGRNRTFQSKLAVEELPVEPAAAFLKPDKKTPSHGILESANALVQGNWDDPRGSITGNGAFILRGGVLEKSRFGALLNDAIKTAASGTRLGSRDDSIPSGDTPQRIEAGFTLGNGGAHFDKLTLERREYSLVGSGSVTFDGDCDAKGRVTFLREQLGLVGGSVQKLSQLLGDVTRLDIPISVRGRLPDVKVELDRATLLREKSGLSAVQSVLSTAGDVVGTIAETLVSPFRSRSRDEQSDEQ